MWPSCYDKHAAYFACWWGFRGLDLILASNPGSLSNLPPQLNRCHYNFCVCCIYVRHRHDSKKGRSFGVAHACGEGVEYYICGHCNGYHAVTDSLCAGAYNGYFGSSGNFYYKRSGFIQDFYRGGGGDKYCDCQIKRE